MTPSSESLDVVGATAALAYFGGLTTSELAHAYLFYGTRGVGKKTFARQLAQSLLCQEEKPGVLGYDGTCAACTSFGAGTHPDFHELVGPISIRRKPSDEQDDPNSVDFVREMSMRPYFGRWRVALLGDVAFATDDAAANALLKFLEDPPADVLVVLTSSNPGSILPTLRSRSLAIEFGPASPAQIAAALERDGVSLERAAVAADAAFGSIGRAKEILDEVETGLRNASFAWFAAAVGGGTPDATFLGLGDKDLSAGQKRQNVGAMLETLRALARDRLAVALAGSDVRLAAPDARATLARLPQQSSHQVLAAVEAIEDVARIAESNVSAPLVVDYLRMRLAPK